MKRSIILLAAIATAAFAQESTSSSPSNYSYEERPGVGLYYEVSGNMANVIDQYKVWNHPYNISQSNGPLMGVGAQMPLNKWFGLNGIVGYQQLKFNFNAGSDSVQGALLDSLPRLDSGDVRGKLTSNNLIVQAGFEAGVPFYTNYQHQLMLKVLVFGAGIGGKTFFNSSKFANTNIWGYSYGGGLRMAWGPVSLEGGVRFAHIYWQAYFDPSDQTGEQASGDSFMLDYNSPVSPFVKATWALY